MIESVGYTDGIYYEFHFVFPHPFVWLEEMTDEELRSTAFQSGTYAFWDDPGEDIYSLEDGSGTR